MSDTHPLILRKLNLIIEGGEKTEAITVGINAYPPCFESRRQYEAWLNAADPETGSQPPSRRDWPKEPNYCRDCNAKGRNEMRLEGRCLFPDTVFVEVGDGLDVETVGTSG